MNNLIQQPEPNLQVKTRRALRRSLIVIILLAIVSVVGMFLWDVYRPLTDVERRLVGTWRNKTVPVTGVFTLHANRTASSPVAVFGGRWYANGNTLHFPGEPLSAALRALFRNQIDDSQILTFEDDDHVTVFAPINGGTFEWVRINRK